jgi:hypothetical protein
MKKIIAATSDDSIGNTFLTWSIYYLSGTNINPWITPDWQLVNLELVENPMTTINAHAHKKIHKAGSHNFERALDLIEDGPDNLYCLYPVGYYFYEIAEKLYPGVSTTTKDLTKDQIDHIIQYTCDTTATLATICTKRDVKWIHVANTKIYDSYRPRQLGNFVREAREATTWEEKYLNVFNWMYPDKLNNKQTPWERRETIALNFVYDDHNKRSPNWDFSQPNYTIEATALWYDLEYYIKHIMNYCSVDIDYTRWDHWCSVYKQWHQMWLENNRLPRNIEHVCESILNGWDHDLTQYDLDWLDECYIQHKLIYEYNTTLKSYGLDKFPGNTRDFKELLETAFYAHINKG